MNGAQLAHVSQDRSAYCHGNASLEEAIINMAQSFIGSNNVNLLTTSCGQFGTSSQSQHVYKARESYEDHLSSR